jgi:hypothetical protein
MAHRIVTVSEVVEVAVTVYTVSRPAGAEVKVTPPLNDTSAELGTLKITTPDPPVLGRAVSVVVEPPPPPPPVFTAPA